MLAAVTHTSGSGTYGVPRDDAQGNATGGSGGARAKSEELVIDKSVAL